MTPERFAQVKEGMTPAEVRKLLGHPNLHNVREYADRGVVAWFYPKDASGAAAAVWFHREKGAAAPTVYMADFEAVRTGEPESSRRAESWRSRPRFPGPPAPCSWTARDDFSTSSTRQRTGR